jgi:hypothetical protein
MDHIKQSDEYGLMTLVIPTKAAFPMGTPVAALDALPFARST